MPLIEEPHPPTALSAFRKLQGPVHQQQWVGGSDAPARVIARAVQKSQHRDEKRHCLWQGSRKMGYDEDGGSWGMWGGVKAAGGGKRKNEPRAGSPHPPDPGPKAHTAALPAPLRSAHLSTEDAERNRWF